MSIRGFIRAFKRSKGTTANEHGGHSLAKTLRESTHVRGGGGMPRAGTKQHHEIVTKGHEQYNKSFKKND